VPTTAFLSLKTSAFALHSVLEQGKEFTACTLSDELYRNAGTAPPGCGEDKYLKLTVKGIHSLQTAVFYGCLLTRL